MPSSYAVGGALQLSALEQCSRWTPRAEETFVPSEAEISRLEADLYKVRRLKARQCCLLGGRLRGSPLDYAREYVGIVVGGKRFIYVNAYPAGGPSSVCDGGSAFWGVVYEPEAREFGDLAFNGVA
jgi:hypothetical protein